MPNLDIRRFARGNGVPLWRVCEAIGISEPTMTRRLRKELSEREKVELKEIIERLAQETQ